MIQPNRRAVIIGAGMVGSTAAYALMLRQIVSEVILIDIAKELVEAQVMDLQQSSSYAPGVKVFTGTYQDVRPNDIVIITCGAAQKPGQSRLDLAKINVKIVNQVIDQLTAVAKPLYILIVTNPVDVVTYFAIKQAKMPQGMVFGSGTSLDTARIRYFISDKLNLNPINIHAYQLGEHGDSSFFAESIASYGGLPITEKLKMEKIQTKQLEKDVRESAYKIIAGKKSTYYGIGAVIASIVEALVTNSGRIFPLSTLLEGEFGLNNVCLSLPVQLNFQGAQQRIIPKLNASELTKLKKSAKVIKAAITAI
ncbi:MAG: L-lactate dehydrogenase [bacterium]